jgi:hypothetical protein
LRSALFWSSAVVAAVRSPLEMAAASFMTTAV